MSIIDKVGEEYKNWESELLQRKAIELLTEEILKGNHQQQNSNNFKKEEENINGK